MSFSTTSTVLFLLLFVSFYVISLSTYTYIASFSGSDLKEIEGDNKIRVKRVIKKDTDDYQRPGYILYRCCAENQYLNNNNQCEFKDTPIPEDRLLEQLAHCTIDDNTLERKDNLENKTIKFHRNYILNLRDENSFAIDSGSSFLDGSYAFSFNDLSLLELSENKSKVVTKFPKHSFCLDFLQSEKAIVVYVNPCAEKLCIQKCCPKKQYFNFIEKKCIPERNVAEVIPKFYFGTKMVDRKLPYYFIKNTLHCKEPYSINKLQIRHTESNVYMQEDGSLLIMDEEQQKRHVYRKENYCIDQFSDGIEDIFINGLLCPSDYNNVVPGAHRFELNSEKHVDVKNKSKPSNLLDARRDFTIKHDIDLINILQSEISQDNEKFAAIPDGGNGELSTRLLSVKLIIVGLLLILFLY